MGSTPVCSVRVSFHVYVLRYDSLNTDEAFQAEVGYVSERKIYSFVPSGYIAKEPDLQGILSFS